MFGFQTLACLHDIPVVRSSTNKLQDVYAQAKNKSALIRLPCSLAETVADKTFKIAFTIANPLVKLSRGPVRVIDDFTVEKIRQIEAKYPVINTPIEEVMNTLNAKAQPVRNVMNSVKDSTTSTIQHGKETVSNAATATVNKATNVADTVYTFCETHVPGKTSPVHPRDFGRRTTLLWERLTSIIGLPILYFLTWFRLLIVSFLLKIKQTNDAVLNQIQQKPLLAVLPQRLLIRAGAILEYIMARMRPENHTYTKQQSRVVPSKQFVSRQTLKPGAFVTTRQSIVVTKQDTSITRNGITTPQYDQEELYPRLPVDHIEPVSDNDINKLHAQIQPTDIERLYSRLPADVIPTTDSQEPLTEDQQILHAKLNVAELTTEGYADDDEEEEDDDYEQ